MAKPLVTLPFDITELASAPTELDYSVFRLDDPVDVLADTTFWVPPYRGVIDYQHIVPTMQCLEVIQSQRAGTDEILPWLPSHVQLCNAAGVHDAATAELAVALILASQRGIPSFVAAQSQGLWRPVEDSRALADSKVLIVGYGSIGRALGSRLSGFECEVLGVTRTGRDGTHSHAELPDLLPAADVVVISTPLSPDTHHLVGAAFLAAMKYDALLVNISRGPVVDTDALLAETRAGRLRAALDVTDPEPLPEGHPLWGLTSVLITPHAGGGTTAMGPRVRALLERQLRAFAAGVSLSNQVAGGSLTTA